MATKKEMRKWAKTMTGLNHLWSMELINALTKAHELGIKVNLWWDRHSRMHLFSPDDEKKIYTIK